MHAASSPAASAARASLIAACFPPSPLPSAPAACAAAVWPPLALGLGVSADMATSALSPSKSGWVLAPTTIALVHGNGRRILPGAAIARIRHPAVRHHSAEGGGWPSDIFARATRAPDGPGPVRLAVRRQAGHSGAAAAPAVSREAPTDANPLRNGPRRHRRIGLAQSAVPLAPVPGGPDCRAFVRLNSVAQLAMLQTIEPLGDEIDAADEAAKQWARDVGTACAGHPEMPLAEAAAAALGAD